ncbi:hypothetical protein M440DRAFT_1403821 [Trichoderma longibrachiatum ATCC 18648]|uniref:Uncharacterized protein n=1 Tax=Trichoderma longibrachiatum ATCC 18648 TaxID=983965 RepID=A0A2T4BYW4_TRILO|nr:hypothetical protein M440DRAFT_1403821 [Trichoderma longibrachiatum ATCC 18648]
MTAQGGEKSIITAVGLGGKRSALWHRGPITLCFFIFLSAVSLPHLSFTNSFFLSAPCPLTNPHCSAVGPPAVGHNKPLRPWLPRLRCGDLPALRR